MICKQWAEYIKFNSYRWIASHSVWHHNRFYSTRSVVMVTYKSFWLWGKCRGFRCGNQSCGKLREYSIVDESWTLSSTCLIQLKLNIRPFFSCDVTYFEGKFLSESRFWEKRALSLPPTLSFPTTNFLIFSYPLHIFRKTLSVVFFANPKNVLFTFKRTKNTFWHSFATFLSFKMENLLNPSTIFS